MTFVTAVLGSLLRAVIVTAFVLAVSRLWSRQLSLVSLQQRNWLWLSILIPGLVPELLLGYAYTPAVIGRPVFAEVICAGLLALRLLPIGVIAWQLTPSSPLTRSAWHVRRMMSPDVRQTKELWRCWWEGPLRHTVPAAAIVGLLAFQEFELAALLKATSWTDWLFTNQQTGQDFEVLVRAAIIPALLQVAMITGAVWALRHESHAPIHQDSGPRSLSCTLAFLSTLPAWGLLVLIPLSSLLWGLPSGFVQLAGQSLRWQGLLREMLGGCAVSVTAACAAWILAAGVPPVIDRRLRRAGGTLLAVLCLPGLSGSLVLSLGLLSLFQRSVLSTLYDTPVMWVLGSTLFLLPRAVLLRLWMHHANSSAVMTARLMTASSDRPQQRSGRAIVWRLRDEPRFLAVCYLAYSSYLELTLAALLAPTGLPSGLVRLYNFLHFGRTAALSAEMAVLLGIPLLFAAVVWGLARRGRV